MQKSSPVMSAAAQPPVRSQMMPDDEDEDESSGISYLLFSVCYFVSVDQGQHTQNIVLQCYMKEILRCIEGSYCDRNIFKSLLFFFQNMTQPLDTPENHCKCYFVSL